MNDQLITLYGEKIIEWENMVARRNRQEPTISLGHGTNHYEDILVALCSRMQTNQPTMCKEHPSVW